MNFKWTEDFESINTVYRNLYLKNTLFGMENILEFLRKHLGIEELNNNIIRNEGYLKSLKNAKIIKLKR